MTPIYPVGSYWVYFEYAQPYNSNIPTGQMMGIFSHFNQVSLLVKYVDYMHSKFV